MSARNRRRKAAPRAKQEQQFKDVEAALAHGADAIRDAKQEIERSHQLIKSSDQLRNEIKARRKNDAPRP